MTAWTDFLAREGSAPTADTIAFADAQSEARATDGATVAVPLVHLGVIRSVGPDSAAFLHNLFSNDVNHLAADAAQWTSFNSPKGRMLASILLWPEAEGHALVVSADLLPALHKKLSMYVLRSKVKLADARPECALIGVAGAEAAAVLARSALPVPAADLRQAGDAETRTIRLDAERFVVAAAVDAAPAVFARLVAAGAVRAGTQAWQLAMVRAGLPLITQPTQEEFVAQMLNYELIGGVNFKKGCYPGQEIVARTQYLGKLKKRMYRVALPAGTAPAPGNDLYSPDFGEQSAGKLVNVAPAPDGGFEALAVMQSSSAEAGEVRLGTPDGPALAFLELPYALSQA